MYFSKKEKKPTKYLPPLKFSWIAALLYLFGGILASWKLGFYADGSADAIFTKYNFDKIIHIGTTIAPAPKSILATYGYSVDLILFGPIWLWSKLFSPHSDFSTPTIIFFRNFGTFIIGSIGFVAIIRWAKLSLSDATNKYAYFTPIMFPVWLGNIFMDSKDVPVVSGFAAILCLAALVVDSDQKEIHRGYKFEVIWWTAVGIIFTIGARPITFLMVLPTLAFILYKTRKKRSFNFLVATILLSLLYIVITNYYLLSSPIYWIRNLIFTGNNFPWTGAMLSWGHLYRSPFIPRRYIIEVLGSQLPLGILLISAYVLLSNFRRIPELVSKSKFSIKLAILGTIFIITNVLVLHPVIYDNARQVLFIYAFFAVLILWFIEILSDQLRKNTFKAFILICVTLTFTDQIKLFPFNYIYINEIARFLPAGSFETDYWGLAGKELSHWTIEDSKMRQKPNSTFAYIFPVSYEPFVKSSSLISVSTNDHKAEYYSQIWRPAILPDFSAQCPIVFSVTRQVLFGKLETLGYVRRC